MRLFVPLLVLITVLSGCNSKSPGSQLQLPPEYHGVLDCMDQPLEGFLDALADAVEAVWGLADLANPPAGMTVTPGATPEQWMFTFAGISGTATFNVDPLGGIEAGDNVTINWSYSGATLAASGVFDVMFEGETLATLSGNATFGVPGDACVLTAAVGANAPLVLSTNATDPNLGVADVAGTVHLHGTSVDDFEADLAFTAGSDEAELRNVLIDGEPVDGVTLPLSSRAPGEWDGSWVLNWTCDDPAFPSGISPVEIRHREGAATAAVITEGSAYMGTVSGNTLHFIRDYGGGLTEETRYTLTSPTTFSKVSIGREGAATRYTCMGTATKQ
jgi:hypothetical protein